MVWDLECFGNPGKKVGFLGWGGRPPKPKKGGQRANGVNLTRKNFSLASCVFFFSLILIWDFVKFLKKKKPQNFPFKGGNYFFFFSKRVPVTFGFGQGEKGFLGEKNFPLLN